MGPDDTHDDRVWALLFVRWLLGLIFAVAGFWLALRRQSAAAGHPDHGA